ncbi:MAG: hypothetical protein IT372_42785 [Polyangiaceae bacterium]|nr:hypothetical protein [Polyangiaceae bacterium]
MNLLYWVLLALVLAAPVFAGSLVPGLGNELGTDLIRWNDHSVPNSSDELSQKFSQMFLEQVYLKNFMKTPELFAPDESEESVVPPTSPIYAELMRRAMAQELSRTDRLKLNAKLKPHFEKRQQAQIIRTVRLTALEIN